MTNASNIGSTTVNVSELRYAETELSHAPWIPRLQWMAPILSESNHVCRSTVSLLEFGGETRRNNGARTDQPVELNDLLTIAKANHDRLVV